MEELDTKSKIGMLKFFGGFNTEHYILTQEYRRRIEHGVQYSVVLDHYSFL